MICHWWISICFLCFCVSRFVACDRNYDWRQRKTQLWKRLLNFRVRMFVKGAVKNWMSKNNRRGREFMFPVTFQRRRRCWFVNSLKFYHFYASALVPGPAALYWRFWIKFQIIPHRRRITEQVFASNRAANRNLRYKFHGELHLRMAVMC